MLKKLSLCCLIGLITVVLLMWKCMYLFLRKNHLSLPNWIGALKLSVLLNFLSPEFALYLYKSIIQPCMEYNYCSCPSVPLRYTEDICTSMPKQILGTTSHFPLMFLQNQKGMCLFITQLMTILMLIGMVFLIIWKMFHERATFKLGTSAASRTNLKLHNIQVTPKVVKKVLKNQIC